MLQKHNFHLGIRTMAWKVISYKYFCHGMPLIRSLPPSSIRCHTGTIPPLPILATPSGDTHTCSITPLNYFIGSFWCPTQFILPLELCNWQKRVTWTTVYYTLGRALTGIGWHVPLLSSLCVPFLVEEICCWCPYTIYSSDITPPVPLVVPM